MKESLKDSSNGARRNKMAQLNLTTDDYPDLDGLAIGDTVTFDITDVSDDGKNFTLEMQPPAQPAAQGTAPAEQAGAPTGVGTEQVKKAML